MTCQSARLIMWHLTWADSMWLLQGMLPLVVQEYGSLRLAWRYSFTAQMQMGQAFSEWW